jgi:fructoselysine-6-P-deglycase FrlB-like protein
MTGRYVESAMTYEPERRPGPPWIMEEMIWAQLDLPEQIARSDDADHLASRLREATDAGQPVLFTGCGTSEHAARAARAIVGDARPDATLAGRDAFEARLALPTGGLVVAISHEAGTAATLDAARGATVAGARAVLITARPEDTPAGVEPIGTPMHDRSWCHTVAYVSPLLLHAFFAGLDPQRAHELIAAQLAARPRRHEDARRLAGCRRLLVVGSGVDEVTAAELALKVEEATHVPTTPLGAEKVLHGHLPAAGRDTGLVLLRFDPDHRELRDARSADVAAAASVLDMPTVELGASDVATRTEALLAGAVALQVLTLVLSLAVGTNPDLIRRDEPLYRRVAEAAGAG